ncbi:integral membrane protein [Paraphoma chrysanthemicola]|uniref:Integral membrane protein n=1 Tax=Paraphoma chrysanthemicola TaxID=798071 RepID=A0A8K0R191_9PLEO|nr:integral membrane protein [Paraphoma chrysanthemicola]
MGAIDPDMPITDEPQPSLFRWILGFLLVGACWGLTTPFMRKAAMNYTPPQRPSLTDPNNSWLKKKALGIFYAVIGVLSRPAYAVPLLFNITGSVWFFILIGKAELSLTVPITNSLAFLFTVLGEWFAEKKTISRDTWIGMAFVLGGIALCVQSKS